MSEARCGPVNRRKSPSPDMQRRLNRQDAKTAKAGHPLNHRDTETQRRHRATHPHRKHKDTRGIAEAQRVHSARGQVPAIERRPGTGGRGSESAGLATPPLYFKVGRRLPSDSWRKMRGGTDAPPARRPVAGTAATEACVRSRRASHRWSAIVRSPAVPPSILGAAPSHQRQTLCVFVFATSFSVSLCLCGSTGGWIGFAVFAASRFQPKTRIPTRV